MRMTSPKLLLAAVILSGAWSSSGADPVIVESRKPDGTPNVPAWTATSGKWTTSKNKSRIASASSLTATNVSVCSNDADTPAFRVSPEGLEPGRKYKVEVTFSTTSTHVASPDLMVAVSAEGLSLSTISTNTPAFKGSGADAWNDLGTIVPATNRPSLTFTYASGTLSSTSRWYADAIRFTPE